MKAHTILLMILLMGSIQPTASRQQFYRPKNGFVPDERTAIRIAEAVLTPIYGEKQVRSEEPFSAKLVDGVWIVSGTIKEGVEGGVAEIKISKKEGTIISLTHGM